MRKSLNWSQIVTGSIRLKFNCRSKSFVFAQECFCWRGALTPQSLTHGVRCVTHRQRYKEIQALLLNHENKYHDG